MHDETQKTADQNRAPSTSTPSVTTAPPTNPAGGRLDDMDKPSDASKTQDTGNATTAKSEDAPKISTETDRPNRKPIDPQGKPSPLTLKTPQTDQPAKTPDVKPAAAANATPNAV